MEKEVVDRTQDGTEGFTYLLKHECGAYQLAGEDVDKFSNPNRALHMLTSPKKVTEMMSVYFFR